MSIKGVPEPPFPMWRKFIDDPVYKQGCELLIGGTEAQLIEYLRKRLDEPSYRRAKGESGAAARAIYHTPSDATKKRGYFVWFADYQGTPADIGTLVHEATHHVHNVFRSTGVDDEEAYCYYISWFVQEAIAHLTKYAVDPRVRARRRKGNRATVR